MFYDKIEPIIDNGVATIGLNDLIPKWISSVSWSCNDDEGQMHTNKFDNILYILDSPVNILSATALTD